MRIFFVLHDLSLTGAPKIGLKMAEYFSESTETFLIARQNGPLGDQIVDTKFAQVIIDDMLHESVNLIREDRLKHAVEIIKEHEPDLIYVNSIAASEWLSAAKICNTKCILHVHEMKDGIFGLEQNNLFDPYDFEYCDLITFASYESQRDFESLFGVNAVHINFGVGINYDEVLALSKLNPDSCINARGVSFKRAEKRKVFAMCGTAVYRKGSDIFWELARSLPEHDFIWIGSWDDDSFVRSTNPALPLNKKVPLKNLYWSNTTSNPAPLILSSDVFLLTSREDPNPLVVLEAFALGTPVVAFSGTGSSYLLTNKYGYTLSGEVDLTRLTAFCKRLIGFDRNSYAVAVDSVELDLKNKTNELIATIKAQYFNAA